MPDIEILPFSYDRSQVAGQSYEDKGIEYIVVKNGESSTAFAIGDVVALDTTVADGYTVKKTTAASQKGVLGVMTEVVAAGSYGLCATKGLISSVKVGGGTTNVAAGDVLEAGALSGAAEKGSTTGSIVGIAMEAATTTALKKVYVSTLGC